jgi:hypothetical protein
MTGITQAQAQAHLDEALEALSAARKVLRYAIGDRTKENQKVNDANADVKTWQDNVMKISRGNRIPIRGITTI